MAVVYLRSDTLTGIRTPLCWTPLEPAELDPLEIPVAGVGLVARDVGVTVLREVSERAFAVLGYDAVCPNLYSREAPGATPDDAAVYVWAQGGVPDQRLIGDVAGAAAYLRSLADATGKVGVIRYCSGGRQAVLAACSSDFDAAVDCYGAYVTGSPPADYPIKVKNWKINSQGCEWG